MIEAVLFDMDGVLIDSVEVGYQNRKNVLAQYGIDLSTIPDPQGEDHRAASLKTLLESIKAHRGVDIDQEEFVGRSREHMHADLLEHGASADPNLVVFLEELKQHEVPLAIVSSGLRDGVDIKLGILGIRSYFSVIVTGSDVENHKPHPDSYQYALEKLVLPPENCVVFEDSITGVQAAQAAGCMTIGFTQYNPPKEPLPGVLATVESWGDINYQKLQAICAD